MFGGRATRGTLYTAAITVAALGVAIATMNGAALTDVTYVPLGCALAVGLLLTVRQAPGHPGAALVLLPALAVAAVTSNVVRGVRGGTLLVAASHAVLAFAVGHLATTLVPMLPTWASFALGFTAVRFGVWEPPLRL